MKIQKIKEAIKDWLLSEWDCLAYTIQQERHKAKQQSEVKKANFQDVSYSFSSSSEYDDIYAADHQSNYPYHRIYK